MTRKDSERRGNRVVVDGEDRVSVVLLARKGRSALNVTGVMGVLSSVRGRWDLEGVGQGETERAS